MTSGNSFHDLEKQLAEMKKDFDKIDFSDLEKELAGKGFADLERQLQEIDLDFLLN